MRLPYIDGQTGVAQRHYNVSKSAPTDARSHLSLFVVCVYFQGMRNRRERMPPPDNNVDPGKVICYPQKHWHKKRYQYLKYFMAPKHR